MKLRLVLGLGAALVAAAAMTGSVQAQGSKRPTVAIMDFDYGAVNNWWSGVWGNYDIALVKKANIRYLVVDSRLADGPPAYGYYFEPGETQGVERLTAADLNKFTAIPGVVQIYNNGPIKIYDLSTILGEVPLTGTHATPAHTLPTR